ncbi:hypothetical protein FACS1894216_02160 [Synergistales bacterium]|nr:hypothetical protein FACS1894216_02160 [Synergistales bacterium]
MNREELRKCLHNEALMGIMKQKWLIDWERKNICDARNTLLRVGMCKPIIDEVEQKIEEYGKMGNGYANLLEDVWGVTWHKEMVIKNHLDCRDDDIDKLPETVAA